MGGEEAIKLTARVRNVTRVASRYRGICAQQQIHEAGHGPIRLTCRGSVRLGEARRRASNDIRCCGG